MIARLLNQLLALLTPSAAEITSIESKVDIVDANVDQLNTDANTLLASTERLTDLEGVTVGQSIIPDLADGIVLTGGAGLWAEGAYVQISAGLASNSYIVEVSVPTITGIHQITIAAGAAAAEVELGSIMVPGIGVYRIRLPPKVAGTRIAAKTASKAGGAQTVTVSLIAVTY